MHLVSIPVLMMAAICLYVAVYYLIMYNMQRGSRQFLTFGLTCLSLFLYDISCAGLYNSTNLSQGIFWQKFNFVGVSCISISFIWFINDFTKARIGIISKIITAYYTTTIPIIILFSNKLTLSTDTPSIKYITIGNRYIVTYFESIPGILCLLIMSISFIAFLILIYKLVHYNRKYPAKSTVLIIAAFSAFYLSFINDMLIAGGAYSFIYVSEYSFMLIILMMGYALQVQFVTLQAQIKTINATLETRIAERTNELKKAKDALWGEMQLAKKIQTVLLPSDPHAVGYQLTTYMHPAESVGGDYYDIINTDKTDWIIIGDVSGHGVDAGIVMMMVQSIIQAKIRETPEIDPSSLLNFVNEAAKYNISKMYQSKFMTIMAFSVKSNGMVTFSGSHDSPIIYRNKSKTIEFIRGEGIILSIVNQKRVNIDGEISLESGDILFLYTDGLTEAVDHNDNAFGVDKLAKILIDSGNLSPDEIKNYITQMLNNYNVMDDVTMVILKKD